jgi:glycosyltransferase involved in cell wall biosynthesis
MTNIAFLDPIEWDYDVSTPYQQPLGGSQSALCYLAVELARRQARVTFFSGTASPRDVMGVTCVSTRRLLLTEFAQPFDALVVLNGPADTCLQLRPHLDPRTPLVLWTQHAIDQPAMQSLDRPEVRNAWDAIVCVSEWHRSTMIERFGLCPERTSILRNAIAPAFEGLFRSRDELAEAKRGRLLLSYTSTPFRGLDLLVPVFVAARVEFPDAELEVFSSMKVYQQDEPADEYKVLYDQCRATPGLRYVGSLPQPRLADALISASLLAYPNTWAETSCIAVMEALAAGLFVVTTDFGALAETTMGFAALVPLTAASEGLADIAVVDFARAYLTQLKEVLRRRAADPTAFAAARMEQVQAVNAQCTWRVRAQQWEQAIFHWKHARQPAS